VAVTDDVKGEAVEASSSLSNITQAVVPDETQITEPSSMIKNEVAAEGEVGVEDSQSSKKGGKAKKAKAKAPKS
jgi:hypothetical protein